MVKEPLLVRTQGDRYPTYRLVGDDVDAHGRLSYPLLAQVAEADRQLMGGRVRREELRAAPKGFSYRRTVDLNRHRLRDQELTEAPPCRQSYSTLSHCPPPASKPLSRIGNVPGRATDDRTRHDQDTLWRIPFTITLHDVAVIALVAVDGSGAGWSIGSSVGLTIAFLAVVTVILVAVIVVWVRRRWWRRDRRAL